MEYIQPLLQIIDNVLRTEVMGLDVGSYLVATAVLLVFLLGRQLFVMVMMAWLRLLTKRTKWALDDHLLSVVEGPMALLPVTLGVFVSAQLVDLSEVNQEAVVRVLQSLIAVSIFWTAYNLVDLIGEGLSKVSRAFTPVMIEWMCRAMRVLFVAIGVASILEMWGVNVTAIIAGLGLFGVAVALGAQDLFKNLIAGVLVIGERRFNRGDWIKVDGVVEGTVEAIGFRSTVVRRFDKAPVYVPNARFSDNAVTNFSAMTHRRISWKIGLEYRTTSAQLEKIRDGINAYILSNDAFANPEDVSTFVRIDSFNDSSIDVFIYCFTKTTNWGEWLEIKEGLVFEIKKIVEEAGAGFAFPSQSVYVESLPSQGEGA